MSASPSKSPEPNAESSKDASEASNYNRKPENTGVEAEVDEAESNSNSGDESDNDEPPPPPPPNAWQAIFSPQHNAYYFYNSETNETTWTNPLQPPDSTTPTPAPSADVASASASTSKSPEPSQPEASTSSHNALQQAAIAAGIDPSLAYLDPSLAMSASTGAPPNTFTAKFNARTGAFTAADSRDPGHLSEFERAKRMSEFYFDVGAWEKDVEARKRAEKEAEESGLGKRKRPTKKDLERFKEQKKEKKMKKTAWLRE